MHLNYPSTEKLIAHKFEMAKLYDHRAHCQRHGAGARKDSQQRIMDFGLKLQHAQH